MKMKRNDIILIIGFFLTALLCAGFYFFIYNTTGDMVQITVDGKITALLTLKENTTYIISSDKEQTNTLEIKDGFASIRSANCPDKLCVHQKKISKQGEALICLPHKVAVSITSSKKTTLDGIAQ